MNINWKQKLSSRKFWAAVAGWATSVATMMGAGDNAARIAALVTSMGTLCVYMLAEGLADGARAESGRDALLLIDTDAENAEED